MASLNVLKSIRQYATNPYLYVGLIGLGAISAVVYLVFNLWLMPSFTRHEVSISVPDVIDLSEEEAAAELGEAGLRTESVILRKPNLPKDVVIDQNPPPFAEVKPGRRVYLTINTGDTTTVVVPRVESYGIRQARNMLMQADLIVGEVLPDSIPSVYEDIITSQSPLPGERVSPGTTVNLLYGTGLGTANVSVPDVTGLPPDTAREALLDLRLRSIVVDDPPEEDLVVVISQAPAPGTSVKEGYEVRLFLRDRSRTTDDQ
jgi:beta-lactam-binding protein with PASTA domain